MQLLVLLNCLLGCVELALLASWGAIRRRTPFRQIIITPFQIQLLVLLNCLALLARWEILTIC